ncbi:MAG: pyrimidine/purine nucleoside phosphorylase [Burkholderiales bacterium]
MTDKIAATVNPQANVYFEGKCVSHSLELPDGSKCSVGVILPATLTFNTGVPEIMETVAGTCSVKLQGTSTWQRYGAGERFSVPANSSFEIRVEGEPYHYICRFG